MLTLNLTAVLLLACVLCIGLLIGCVGVGGILLSPALMYIGALDLHLAIATGMWSFLFTGVTGAAAYMRHRSIDWPMIQWLSAGIVPAAVVGARANAALSPRILTLSLAGLTIAAGINALARSPTTQRRYRALHPGILLPLGVTVGFGSALTGTGGPVLLVPLLLFLGVPALVAIGASQVIQIPVALIATIVYARYGRVDFVFGTALGAIAAVGVVLGTRLAHVLPGSALRRITAIALVGVGSLMLLRALGVLGSLVGSRSGVSLH